MTLTFALVWILLFPLLGATFNGLMGRWMPKKVSGAVACLAILGAFLTVVSLTIGRGETIYAYTLAADWLPYDLNKTLDISFYFDTVTQLMTLLITGVGFLIHLYSVGYMEHDKGFARYFSYLNLFTFFMLLLVLSNNLLTLFVGWEGVGLCSYLLIGFWFHENANAIAGKKAFIVNRIGDAGFILGMLLLLTTFGTLSIHPVTAGQIALANLQFNPSTLITLATLCLFVGAMGKSAQFPLLVWLPDAMAGPTPVSALIHAATMVTAGVYMMIRLQFIYIAAPETLHLVAVIGALTAFYAACSALGQKDIKKVLAFSTVSQLGYMFMGVGVGAFGAALFHLVSHGFFKALLFLGAGSVIHATHGEQDMGKMGALKKYLPLTTPTFAIGSMALAGIPPFAGWFSKGSILEACHAEGHHTLWTIGLITAVITAIYTTRLFVRTFLGEEPHGGYHEKPHESPMVMTLPLLILAVLSLIGGWKWFPLAHLSGAHDGVHPADHTAEIIETLLILIAVWVGVRLFKGKSEQNTTIDRLGSFAEKGFLLDHVVTNLGTRFVLAFAAAMQLFERVVVDGTIGALGSLTKAGSFIASTFQRSSAKSYIVTMLLGVIFIFWAVLWCH